MTLAPPIRTERRPAWLEMTDLLCEEGLREANPDAR